jgi:succinate dehydrogenase/fumarate reductase flavoprotein subunit
LVDRAPIGAKPTVIEALKEHAMANSTLEVDVTIIGGGGAGIPAAIEVARAGGKAAVLEQADSCGGTAAISGGGCCIVGTPLQKAQGIEDTPDLAFEDWVKWGQGAADEVWARFYLEHTLHDLYHWAKAVAQSGST